MRVPGHVAEGRRSPFPQGNFIGALKGVQAAHEENGTAAFLLSFRDITPTDDKSPEVNGRPKTQRVQVADLNVKGEVVYLADVQEFNDDVPLSLQRSATLLVQLALALGAATKAGNGDVDVEMDAFLQDLENKVFDGNDVAFEVTHRAWTSKKLNPDGTKKSGIGDDIVRFAASANGAAPAVVEAPAAVTPAPSLRGSRGRK